MPSRSNKKRDFIAIARAVVEKSIGEQLDGAPLEEPAESSKNPHAVALGRLGGLKGGRARSSKLTPAERKSIARKAASARWPTKN